MNEMTGVNLDRWWTDPDSKLSKIYSDALDWCKTFPAVGLIRTGYRAFCAERGLSMLSASRSIDLSALAALLGPEATANVFSAPRIAWRILQDGFSATADGLEIAEALMAEAVVGGMEIPVDKRLFSARCDYLVSAAGIPGRISKPAGNTSISLETAETRNHLITSGNSLGSTFYEGKECEAATEKVCLALEELSLSAPNAHTFVSEMMDILILKKRNSTALFETGTFSGYAGLVLFTNTHTASLVEIIEGLVHEAVHCMLYMHEAIEGGFLLDRNKEDQMVTSPWTGARIRFQSFVHACLVWYAVCNLWTLFAEMGLDTDCSMKRARFARQGFVSRPVTHLMEKQDIKLRPGMLSCLQTVENRMIIMRN